MPQKSYINWRRMRYPDIAAVTYLSDDYFSCEMSSVFTINPAKFKYDLARAVLSQEFDPRSCLLVVAELDNRITGWFWVSRGGYTTWSEDEMAEIRFIHVEQDLPAKYRVKFVKECLEQAELWSMLNSIPVLCSSSIRNSQDAFLRIHSDRGYLVQGSVAWIRTATKLNQVAK